VFGRKEIGFTAIKTRPGRAVFLKKKKSKLNKKHRSTT
jgi:hypothetical protein